MKTLFSQQGQDVWLRSDINMNLRESLAPGNYVVRTHPLTQELYLSVAEPFVLPSKLYGELAEQCDRIMTTFSSRAVSTGVLMVGEKGSGKSLLAKLVSSQASKAGVPTIIINTPFAGERFNSFIQSIEQPAVVLFDEFEKMYAGGGFSRDDDNDKTEGPSQQYLLTLLDGLFNSKKLFLLTCNNRWKLDRNMLNRPGRLYYHLEFSGLSSRFVKEYCTDRLEDQKHTDSVVRLSGVFEHFNFDMLQALVEEMNRYHESPVKAMKLLNIKQDGDRRSFAVEIRKGNTQMTPYYANIDCNPTMEEVSIFYFPTKQAAAKRDDAMSICLLPEDLRTIGGENGVYIAEKNGLTITLKEKRISGVNLERYLAS